MGRDRRLSNFDWEEFAPDSPLEGTGFEPSVPGQEKWSMPGSSDQTRVGRTLTLGGSAESSLEGRDIELVWGFSCQVVVLVCCQFFVRSGKAVLRPVACDQVSRSARKGSRDRNGSKARRLAA